MGTNSISGVASEMSCIAKGIVSELSVSPLCGLLHPATCRSDHLLKLKKRAALVLPVLVEGVPNLISFSIAAHSRSEVEAYDCRNRSLS